mgnify:CR=1 FL=1
MHGYLKTENDFKTSKRKNLEKMVEKKYFCDYCEYCEDLVKDDDVIGTLFTCQTCHLVKYCSVECQTKAKPEHQEFCHQREKDLQSLESVISHYPSLKIALEHKDFALYSYGITLESCQKELLIKIEDETYVIAEEKQDYFCYMQGMELCWFLMCDSLLLLQKITPKLGIISDIGLASEVSQLKEKIAVLGGKLSLYELILDLDPHRIRRYIPNEDNLNKTNERKICSRVLSKVESNLIFSNDFWIKHRIPRLYWSFMNIIYDLKQEFPYTIPEVTKGLLSFRKILESFPPNSSAQRLVKTDVVMDSIKEKLLDMIHSDCIAITKKSTIFVHSAGGSKVPKVFDRIVISDYLYGFKAFYGYNGSIFLWNIAKKLPEQSENYDAKSEFANRCHRYLCQDKILMDFLINNLP